MIGTVTGILLAAGQARRFGANKLLALLADGRPVGQATADTLAGEVDRMVVVVGETDDRTAELFETAGYATVRCSDAALGMAHSLRCGVAATRESGAWLVMLADMPAVQAATLREIVARVRRGAQLVVPRHAGRDGHPVAFAAAFRAELEALTGDRGARPVLDRHAAAALYLDVDDPGVLLDIDTPADLARVGLDDRKGSKAGSKGSDTIARPRK